MIIYFQDIFAFLAAFILEKLSIIGFSRFLGLDYNFKGLDCIGSIN